MQHGELEPSFDLSNLERKIFDSETLTPWVGREKSRHEIEQVVRSNFYARKSTDHAAFTFLVASGHVRSGKTRTGIELPGIISRVFESDALGDVLSTV